MNPLLPMFQPKRRRDIRRRGGDYKPTYYKSYFDTYKDVPVNDGTEACFRVYLSGFINDRENHEPLLLLLHGAGYSGLTWSLFAKEIVELVHVKVAAFDLRGHGNSKSGNDEDLSMKTLVDDVGRIFKELVVNWEIIPSVIIMGHSMGGALAVNCANYLQESIPNVVGIVVIDVVEGTAMAALQNMHFVLNSRPKAFKSLPCAIEWCCRTGQTRNVDAAKVSMPGQLINLETNECATADVEKCISKEVGGGKMAHLDAAGNVLLEEEQEEGGSEASKMENKYGWRIDLSKTEPFWKGWFEGLSNLFLFAPVQGRMLLLAGVDRLDKDLTVGQMQGKFQMQVLPHCGHAIHEDVPDKVAEAIATFLTRNKFTTPKKEFIRPFPSC